MNVVRHSLACLASASPLFAKSSVSCEQPPAPPVIQQAPQYQQESAAPSPQLSESDEIRREKLFGHWPPWSRNWNDDWDGRHPIAGSSRPPLTGKRGKTTRVILLRHGQYNLKTKELTDLGRDQSRITGERLAKLATGKVSDHYGTRRFNFLGVYHSDLPRARETAEIVARQLPPTIPLTCDGMLAEGWPCVPQPYRDTSTLRASSLMADSTRIEAAFRKYVHRQVDHKKKSKKKEAEFVIPPTETAEEESIEDVIVLICHQNVIRYFVCRSLQLPPEDWLRFGGDNCGVTELVINEDSGRVSLVKFGDTGHLPLTHITFH